MNALALLLAVAPLAPAAPIDHADRAPNLVELATEAGTFQTLLTAAKAAGLADTLAKGGPFTVFAPSDEAFGKLPEAALAALLRPENKAKLVEVLSYHVLSGEVSAAGAVEAGRAQTLSGGTLAFAIRDGRLRVNESSVVANDLSASNGIVHVIDRVLEPPSGFAPPPAGRLVLGIYTERPSKALAAQLGLDRHRSILVTGLSKNAADGADLEPYDVIVSIDGKPATDEELRRAKQRAGFGGTIELGLFREARRLFVHATVGIERH